LLQHQKDILRLKLSAAREALQSGRTCGECARCCSSIVEWQLAFGEEHETGWNQFKGEGKKPMQFGAKITKPYHKFCRAGRYRDK
jgi:hypothetical protein